MTVSSVFMSGGSTYTPIQLVLIAVLGSIVIIPAGMILQNCFQEQKKTGYDPKTGGIYHKDKAYKSRGGVKVYIGYVLVIIIYLVGGYFNFVIASNLDLD